MNMAIEIPKPIRFGCFLGINLFKTNLERKYAPAANNPAIAYNPTMKNRRVSTEIPLDS